MNGATSKESEVHLPGGPQGGHRPNPGMWAYDSCAVMVRTSMVRNGDISDSGARDPARLTGEGSPARRECDTQAGRQECRRTARRHEFGIAQLLFGGC